MLAMKIPTRLALAGALFAMAAGPPGSAFADEARDAVIAAYYSSNPRDDDFRRWRDNRDAWTDEDYLRWYTSRTLDFQTQPGVAAAFGVTGTGDSMPGFQVN